MDNENPIVARLHELGRDSEHEILFEITRELGARSTICALIIFVIFGVGGYVVTVLRRRHRRQTRFEFIE